ncbi:MAG TPA: hypothetical protein VMW29_02855, partial [Candidatus Bathyarchaeia archaeon]|nr:hypothetical protein [Candidatus Bathyarchaeia archaeon]
KIIRFSGIKKFIDSPLYTYSSGMKLRLGFSVAVYSNPDILIVDEIISVGDENFRNKSLRKIQKFFKAKKTIIFVSHNFDLLKKLCSHTIWLEHGRIKASGPSEIVIKKYIS